MGSLIVLIVLSASVAGSASAVEKNGFNLDNASVPIAKILSGGPTRDGIPAINDPKLISAADADYLAENDRILGVEIGGVARAYPVKILNWHEIVNDRIESQRFVVSYCPLCGSGMVFASNVGESALIFGVSGLLYNSDMLLFDRNTESLWSQIMAEAISGKLQGIRLPQIPTIHTSWADWLARHPTTTVLSSDTGYRRNYDRSPYGGYAREKRLYFSVSNNAPRDYHPKALVLGVELGGVFKAYPFEELETFNKETFVDRVGDSSLLIHWDKTNQSAHVSDDKGVAFPATVLYWFAWYTFHPDTLVFKVP